MNGNEEFKAGEERGIMMGKLDAITVKLQDLDKQLSDFRVGMGQRVENHGLEINTLKNEMSTIRRVSGWIFAPAIMVIVVTVLGLIIIRK